MRPRPNRGASGGLAGAVRDKEITNSLTALHTEILTLPDYVVVPEKPRLGFSLGVPCMVFIETEPLVWMGLHQAAAGAITTQAR